MSDTQTPNTKHSALKEQLEQMSVEEFERLQQLANLGELVGGFAHELRNPVAGIRAALQTLSRGVGEDNPQYEIYQEVCSAANRLDGLVSSLLSFARMGKSSTHPINVNDAVREAVRLFEQDQSNAGKTHIELAENLPLLNADIRLLQQVVLNLLNNAQQATKGKLELAVSTQYQPPNSISDVGPNHAMALHRCQHGVIQVRISDNGPGVNEPDIEAVFKPFFTTKENGAGLGLSISHRIIQEHHGCLFYRNNPDQGTTFVACLPLTDPSLKNCTGSCA
ncbi:MAG: ATP-binding protein [Candidatus Hinthialibacter antarcticus]|nr:ATP-binding protein [Candidatus Hinthialibacter antarcticus]